MANDTLLQKPNGLLALVTIGPLAFVHAEQPVEIEIIA